MTCRHFVVRPETQSMPSKHWLLSALAALATSGPLLCGAALADELAVPASPERSADRPTPGMSMEKVEARFGAPAKRIPAVGAPPISRWEYPGFVVYFENNLVIHAVAIG
jgi:hypothetical protein